MSQKKSSNMNINSNSSALFSAVNKKISLNGYSYLQKKNAIFNLGESGDKPKLNFTRYSERDSESYISISSTFESDLIQILDIIQDMDVIIELIVLTEKGICRSERYYFVIVYCAKIFARTYLGITITDKKHANIGLNISERDFKNWSIESNLTLKISLRFKHPVLVNISSVMDFWLTIQYLNNPISFKFKRVASCISLSKGKNSLLATTNSHQLDENRIVSTWHDNKIFRSTVVLDLERKDQTIKNIIEGCIYETMLEFYSQKDSSDITISDVNTKLAEKLHIDISPFRTFVSNQVINTVGMLEKPSKVNMFILLGSEFNAADKRNLVCENVKYILNVTSEIDNFHIGHFEYFNINVFDEPTENIIDYFNVCYEFINKAKKEDCFVLVHCQMGMSRSATVVIAYLMKSLGLSFEKAHALVKHRRPHIKPNQGFIEQLRVYEGILQSKQSLKRFSERS